MKPGIGRSLLEGFRAANRSWAAIGFSLSVLLATILFVIVSVALSLPSDLMDEARREHGTIPLANVPSTPQPSGKSSSTLFQELSVAKEPLVGLQPPVPASSTVDDQQAQGRRREEQRQRVRVWLAKAWPVLAICLFLFIAVNLWLIGGQIGYAALQVAGGRASLSDFAAAGARAFGALLAAALLSVVMIAGLAGLMTGVVVGGPHLAPAMSVATRRALEIVAIIACAVGSFWYLIRLSFWGIAIVQDRLDPIAALQASLAATRGRFWKTLGLGMLAVSIFYGARLPFSLIGIVVAMLDGAGAVVLWLLSGFILLVANLYVSFAITAAYVRFYEDATKLDSPQPSVAQ